jgi:hypothetical protein
MNRLFLAATIEFRDMICLEAQYFNLNKILLQVIGLWPFEQSKPVQLQFTILFSILVSALICQVR